MGWSKYVQVSDGMVVVVSASHAELSGGGQEHQSSFASTHQAGTNPSRVFDPERVSTRAHRASSRDRRRTLSPSGRHSSSSREPYSEIDFSQRSGVWWSHRTTEP